MIGVWIVLLIGVLTLVRMLVLLGLKGGWKIGVWIVLLTGELTLVRMELPTGKGVHSSIPFTGVDASIEAMACGEARV